MIKIYSIFIYIRYNGRKVVSMYVHFIIICVGTATFVLQRYGPDCLSSPTYPRQEGASFGCEEYRTYEVLGAWVNWGMGSLSDRE